MIEANRIKSFLVDDGTGVLYWAVDIGQRARTGNVAGYLHFVRMESRWTIQLGGRKYLRSHLVFAIHNDRWVASGLVLDHIDKNTLNDSINNLREVTQKVNMETRFYPDGHARANG